MADCEVSDTFVHPWQQRWANVNKIGFLACVLIDFVVIIGAASLICSVALRLASSSSSSSRRKELERGKKVL